MFNGKDVNTCWMLFKDTATPCMTWYRNTSL